ncbi:MAG: ATP-binding protein [Byssovorax sp.]
MTNGVTEARLSRPATRLRAASPRGERRGPELRLGSRERRRPRAAPRLAPSNAPRELRQTLFEVVTRRYNESRSILLSTNKPFAEWSQVFPHAACVVTLIDRLVHRAEIIDIDAESYRLKEAKARAAKKAATRGTRKRAAGA